MSNKIVKQKIKKIKKMGKNEIEHFERVVAASLLEKEDKEELFNAIDDRKKIVYQQSGVFVERSEEISLD